MEPQPNLFRRHRNCHNLLDLMNIESKLDVFIAESQLQRICTQSGTRARSLRKTLAFTFGVVYLPVSKISHKILDWFWLNVQKLSSLDVSLQLDSLLESTPVKKATTVQPTQKWLQLNQFHTYWTKISGGSRWELFTTYAMRGTSHIAWDCTKHYFPGLIKTVTTSIMWLNCCFHWAAHRWSVLE